MRGLQAIRWDARVDRDLAAPGTYRVRLADNDDVAARSIELRPDPATRPRVNSTGPATNPSNSR